ncbi:hypothetical protein [Hyphomicrobium sp. ghe19]|uniref:hypothetical protein n=1 Tax=Hyphomicrobium sp. ghe19 TaxID=2682968 RepID=UPI001367162C|nr:hypothetical protein HYPP_01933 [Hyphomicrobium sp. ghe19]
MTWLFSLLTGGLLNSFIAPLERAYQAKLAAMTNKDKLAADQAVKFYEGQIALATTAAQYDKWWSTRELIGKCALLYVAKIVVWDTVLGWGITPDPGPQVSGIVMMVIGFYFGSKAATDIAARLLGAVVSKR